MDEEEVARNFYIHHPIKPVDAARLAGLVRRVPERYEKSMIHVLGVLADNGVEIENIINNFLILYQAVWALTVESKSSLKEFPTMRKIRE